jgi:hypothetical protein
VDGRTKCSICNADEKQNKPQWTIELRNALAKVIDGFQGYNNTLAFFVANEFVNSRKSPTPLVRTPR